MLARVCRTLRKIRDAEQAERALLAEALALACVVRIALSTMPSSVVIRSVARVVAVVPAHPRAPEQVAWAVAAIGTRVPGANCLVRALVGEAMLARSGQVAGLRFGVRRVRAGLEAHAWVEQNGVSIIGHDEEFVPLERMNASRACP